MRPNVAETKDPLNLDLLPDSARRMELNYRTATDPAAVPQLWSLMSNAVLSAATLFAARLLLQLQPPRLVTALLTAVSLLVLAAAVTKWRRGQVTTAALVALSAPVLVITLLTPASPGFVWVALLFAVCLTVRLALAWVEHAAAWYSADFSVAISDRRRFLTVWNPRTMDRALRDSGGSHSIVRMREAAEREALRSRLLLVSAACVAGIALQVLFADDLSESLIITLALAAFFIIVAVRSVQGFCASTGRSRAFVLASIRRGAVLWFGYNHHGTHAPGVMLSPAGFSGQRRRQFWLAFATFCATCTLACSYFAGTLRSAGEQAHTRLLIGQRGPVSDNSKFALRLTRAGHSAVVRLRGPVEGRILLGLLTDLPRRWPALVMAVVVCAVLAPLTFLMALLAICGRTLAHFAATFDADSPYRRDITIWNAAVERLRQSRDRLESEHVWLGIAVETDSPVIMHRQLATEHVHLMGSTGSNKTSVGVTQLLEQLIGPDSSLLVLDLKGDMALFEAARLAAANARDRSGTVRPIRFRWFTSESNRSSYTFNPLSQSYLTSLPRLERTQILSRALGLEHGEGYGRGHFSSQNRNALLKLLTACPDVDSFRKLHEEGRRQKKLFTSWEREHASDFFSTIHTLANIDALNLTQRDRIDPSVLTHAIDMSDLVREPNIAYFRLPATSQAAANREIGKLAIYGLLTALRQLGRFDRQIYIVIDEFQQLVSYDLAVILQQARSYGIGVIMAHQTQSDLKLPETDMTQVVEENTHFKQIFSVNDLGHRKALEQLSGEALYHLAGWKQGFEAYGDNVLAPGVGLPSQDLFADDVEVNVSSSVGPRLRANDLIEMSARPNLCMVQFKRNVGYGQYDGFPILMLADYHIPRSVYQQRLSAPWPSPESASGLIVAPLPGECFFYQIGVEKTSAMRQMPLPFVLETPSDASGAETPPALTNPPSASGESMRAAADRNPIADALDSL